MEFKPETPIDQALQMAREDAKAGNLFYDAFLNSDVFIPVRKEGADQGSWSEVEANERFFPLFLKHQETKMVPVFDRLERLQFWAESRALDYVKVRCHLFLKTLAPDIGVALNLANAFSHFFEAKTVEHLRQATQTVLPS